MANIIHPTAIVESRVELGSDNYIGPYSVILGPTVIGDRNWIGPHVTIGTPGQDTRNPSYDSSECRIEIGNENIIREYTAIQKPCYSDVTKIGNKVFLMQSVHIAHDVMINDGVVITPMVALGGIVTIMKGANIALGCVVHQRTIIGHYSIVGMGTVLTKNVRPFSKSVPGKPVAVNEYAVEKFGFSNLIDQISGYVLDGIKPTDQGLAAIVDEFECASVGSGRKVY